MRSERGSKTCRFFTVFNIYELRCDVRLGCILPKGVLRGVCPTDYLRILEVLHADARRGDQYDRSKEVVQISFHGLHRESSPKVARNSDRGDYVYVTAVDRADRNRFQPGMGGKRPGLPADIQHFYVGTSNVGTPMRSGDGGADRQADRRLNRERQQPESRGHSPPHQGAEATYPQPGVCARSHFLAILTQ